MPTWSKPFPKPNPYECSAGRHLWRYGLSLAIYNLVGTVTAGGKSPFFGQISRLSNHFGSNPEATRRAFKRLVNDGWLDALPKKGHYRYVSHAVHAFVTSEGCVQREDLPHWSADANPFVGKLYALAGGKFRAMPHWIAAAKKHCTEEEFLIAYRNELEFAKVSKAAGKWENMSPSACFWRTVGSFRPAKTGKTGQRKTDSQSPKSTVENPVYK